MFAISTTDDNWFKFLKQNNFNSYVNFWNPTPWNIKKMKLGERWYFLLKSPIRAIAGFGEFYKYENLTAFEAWKLYGHKNGTVDLSEFINVIQIYIDKHSDKLSGIKIDINTYKIGCIILNNCQFWDSDEYKVPEHYQISFKKQIVKYKYFTQYDPFKIDEEELSNGFKFIKKKLIYEKAKANSKV